MRLFFFGACCACSHSNALLFVKGSPFLKEGNITDAVAKQLLFHVPHTAILEEGVVIL